MLLSDFDLWHAPLNATFLGTEKDSVAFDRKCEQRGYGDGGDFWQDTELTALVCDSWELCLDLDWHAPDWFGVPYRQKKIQGVMWEIRPEDLIRHRFYTGWKWRA